MVIFKTKKIQSFIVFIIVLGAILWIFQDNILSIPVFKKTTEESELSKEQLKDIPYLEKIDNFIIKEYSSDQVLLYTSASIVCNRTWSLEYSLIIKLSIFSR